MSKKLYLAYGSNMNKGQMKHRCPDATVEGKAVLQDYELVFMGRSESAVANILPAKGETVPVVIWSISERDERNLDVYEGYPHLYTKETVRVELNGAKIEAMAYVMTPGHKYGRPAYRYYQTIAEGYTSFKISYEYLKQAVNKSDARFHARTSIIDEHLQMLSEQQVAEYSPVCPRCGKSRMKPKLYTNALSRRADIYICDFCGSDEALRDALGYTDSVADWFAIKKA